MQFNLKTDYAIRLVLYLAGQKKVISAQELANATGVPKKYVFNIISDLRQAGFVASTRGVNGGFYLVKEAGEISLWDIADITESTMQLSRAAGDGLTSEESFPEYRMVDSVYRTLQCQMEATLRVTTVSEILRCSGRA